MLSMTKKKRGRFITFEGTEGVGKSTLIREVQKKVHQHGLKSILTREPGGSPVAEKIRRLILKEDMDPWTELFLYEASRAEHLAQTVRPALAEGKIILCDRFTDSSLAYQAHARGLPWKEVKALNKQATRGMTPDLTVFIDLDPEVGLKRVTEVTRFELEGLEFQKKVRRGFLKARRESPKHWLTLKVKKETPQELAEQVWHRIEADLSKK